MFSHGFSLLVVQVVAHLVFHTLPNTSALHIPYTPSKSRTNLGPQQSERKYQHGLFLKNKNVEDDKSDVNGENISQSENRSKNLGRRRALLSGGLSIASVMIGPNGAFAGIDVSGIRVEGSTPGSGTIAQQLRATSTPSAAAKPTPAPSTPLISPSKNLDPTIATSAPTFSEPRLSKSMGPNATPLTRYDGQLVGPPDSKVKVLDISFQFPFDWLQLDRVLGGIQFVDQRNGDKLYMLRAQLPEDSTLATVSKQWFGTSIFDPKGSISSGINIDEYKVITSSVGSQIVSCPTGACSTDRRRLKINYATVTGNGLRVERRALVDAFEVDNWCYMLVTGSNAVNFEKKGRERDTVEAIVDSFRFER